MRRYEDLPALLSDTSNAPAMTWGYGLPREIAYRDHADTVAAALAHWHDHLWRDYLDDRKASPESFDKHTGIGSIHRRRWASRLWDARRALRALG